MEELWPTPSEPACTVIRAIAEKMLPVSEDVVDRLWAASQREARQREYREDPVLSDADRRFNKAILTQWLVSNLHEPGRRVALSRDTEMLIYARDLVLRGLDTDELPAWRAAQRVVLEVWLDECFAAVADRAVLRELAEVSANSLCTYIDDSISGVSIYVDEVLAELGKGAHPDRHSTVQLLLEGARLARGRAEEQLGYALTGHHVAAIVWADSVEEARDLERAAEYVMRACGGTHRLTLVTSSASLWLWIPATSVPPVDDLLKALAPTAAVRVALGRPGPDIVGFRTSHLEAAAAQRLLARIGSPRRVVRYEDVHLIDLLTTDLAQAERFVAAALGELATADPVIQQTVRTYVDEGFSVSNTAERLYAHRNTIDRRLARARALLPRPLDEDATSVAAALMFIELREDHTPRS